jgi:hypothetical protein
MSFLTEFLETERDSSDGFVWSADTDWRELLSRERNANEGDGQMSAAGRSSIAQPSTLKETRWTKLATDKGK